MNAGTHPNFGYQDWHLPNRNEIYSLIDFSQYNPALPSGHPFTDVQLDVYWSSTSNVQHTSTAWYVYMPYGRVSFGDKTPIYNDKGYVWPVRTGQAVSKDRLFLPILLKG